MSAGDKKKHSLEGFITSTVPLTLLANSRNTEGGISSESSGTASQWYVASDHQKPRATQVDDQEVQILQEDSVFDPSSESVSQPLRPRDVEHERSFRERPLSSDSEVLSMQTVLMRLDKEEENRRRRTLQMDHYTKVMQPVSWEETAEVNCHLWVERDTREACYLNDTQYCQDQKLLHSKRHKVRCSACKILVHTTCMKQLCYEGGFCKPTFREIKQKEKKSSVQHHFLKRRKLSGKCAANCGRGFGNFKSLSGRVFEGFSCSWCGDSYHLGCFSEKLRDEVCHLGPFRNLIIPSSWIIKLPQIEPEPSPDPEKAGATGFGSSRKKKASRRKTRRNPSSSDDRPSKFFTVKPFVSSNHKPLLVFINPKSGGNQGAKLMQTFQWLLNPRQVFDLTKGGPKFGLSLFKNCSNMRILACGGDGTVGWVLSVLDQLDFKFPPPVAVLPLGTGNDLARVLNWGGAYGDEPLENILMHVENGSIVELDRWVISIWRNEEVENYDEFEGKENVPLHVINNYFSIGADAQVSLDFHDSREANPQKFNNRFKNKFAYSRLTGQELVLRKFANLTDNLRLVGDGHDFTQHIRQLRLEALCFLNITSYGSGNNPWGTPPPGTFSGRHQIGAQAMDDGLIEIVGFWASTFPKLLMGAHGERIAHCQHIKIYTYASLPVQIDGEACKLKPSIIEIVLQNKALMVRKEALRTQASPLRGLSDNYQLKLSVSKVSYEQYQTLHSDLKEIKKAATGLGLVLTTASQSLHSLRPQIERFTQPSDYGKATLSKNWQYLDVASTGRLDQVFQILPEQEGSVLVGNMLSDGILVIDYASSSDDPPEHALEEQSSEKPKVTYNLERKASYTMAVADISDNELLTEGLTKDHKEAPAAATIGSKDSLSSSPISPDLEDEDSDRCLLPEVTSGLSPLPKLESSNSDDDSESGASYSILQKALFDAVKRGNLKKVEEVHHKGARLANVDQHGLSPLHHASRLGRKDVVQYLVSNVPKDSLDLQDEEKAQTALHKAAWYGYRGICKILVEAGASLLRTDYQGNTPYLKSIESEDSKLQEYLLRKEREEKIRYEIEEVAV